MKDLIYTSKTSEIGAVIRSYDWAQTPLGAINSWSSDLKVAVQILVTELDRLDTAPVSQNAIQDFSEDASRDLEYENLLSKNLIPESDSLQDLFRRRYNILFNSIDCGFGICEMLFDDRGLPLDYRFLEVNNLFAEMAGLEPDQLVGNTAYTLFPHLESLWAETFGRVVSTRNLINFDHYFAQVNKWYEINAFAIDDPQQHRFGILYNEITNAITDRLYAPLLDSIDQGFCMCEMIFDDYGAPLDYRFLAINNKYELMTGLTDVIGKTAKEVMPTLEDFWFENYGLVVQTGKSVRFENYVSAMHQWFDVNAFPIESPHDRTNNSRFGILFTDISDRKQQELNNNFLAEIQTDLIHLTSAEEIMEVVGTKLYNWFGFSLLTFSNVNAGGTTATTVYNNRDADIPYINTTHHLLDYFCEVHLDQLRTGQTVAIADVTTNPDLKISDINNYATYHIRSLVTVPYLRNSEWKFFIAGCRRTTSIWSAAELELISELTERIYLRIERARSQLTLREINHRFETVLQSVNGIIFELDVQSDMVYRSEGLLQLVGVMAKDADPTKQWWLGRIHPEDIPQREATFASFSDSKINRYQSEYRIRHEDGRWIDVWEQGNIERNADGEIVKLFGFTWDISDRKYAERKLKESERIYRAIGETINYGIWICDKDGNNTYSSQSFLDLLGITQAECSGLDWSHLLHPDDRETSVADWLECVRTGNQFDSEQRYLGTDQKYHDVLARGNPVYDDQGELICWTGIALDVSRLKESEARLRQSEERYRSLVELIPQLIWKADAEGKVIDVNQRFLDYTGLATIEAVKNLSLEPLTHPDDYESLTDAWQRSQSLGIPLKAEGRIRRHDGVYRWHLHQAIPSKNENDEVIRWIIACTDIEEQKQLERDYANLVQEVQERNQELDQFTHNVSHDLKAPLRGISNLSQWIEEDLKDSIPPENKQQLQLMRLRVYRMEGLINGLLNYARIGREQIASDLVSMPELLSEILDSLDPPSTFRIEIASDLPTFSTKRILLSQVLSNLIGNAIKHHDRPDGKIIVSFREYAESPEFYEFVITDDGKGIDPNQQKRIFDIFHTLERDNSDSTGIGLAIVKKIVETEGGKIYLQSEFGKGSSFYFTWCKFAIQPPAPNSGGSEN